MEEREAHFVAYEESESEGVEGGEVIIKCENVHKTYLLGVEGVAALRGVSLSVRKGEFLCIFGTSGGGKTTLLNVLGTIDKPSKGYLTACGVRVGPKTKDHQLAMLRLRKLGFVFQTFNLLSSLTALENVELPMVLAGDLSASERRERAISLLTRVGMHERMDHVPSQMSGGEQQRVTIARAVANRPDVLLLDEACGDLDAISTAMVMELFTELNKQEGITLVMVTHDQTQKFFADRVVWMRDGRIARIEVVDDQKRQAAYRDLEAEMLQVRAQRATGHAPPPKRDPLNPWAHSKVRTPEHYAAFSAGAADTSHAKRNTRLSLGNYAQVVAPREAEDAEELTVALGQLLQVLGRQGEWMLARDAFGREGLVPSTSLRELSEQEDGHGLWLMAKAKQEEMLG